MFILAALFVSQWNLRSARAESPFELQDGDRVVFLGSEFTEQAIKYNYVEATLTSRWPERHIIFRNLGWAGDDPTAVARGYFGGAEEGYRRLQEELARLKPTVIFVAYGENSAYAGAAGIPKFKEEMKRLLTDLRKLTDRIILVSPPAAEKLASPLPDPAQINDNRRAITAVLKKMAEAESFAFIDLFTPLAKELQSAHEKPFTNDTIRYNATGYAAAADATLSALGVTDFSRDGTNAELLELLRVKNNLYFHLYRPQNETYLRGFRKREQGQNAKEIAEFEPLIRQAEARITAFVRGESLPPMIEDLPPKELDFSALPPEKQREEFAMAPGLEIHSFAAEPLIANPINMNFDSRGRLWVATSPIYPQIRPGAAARDEIVILEDTDGDHVADKKTVFADNLLIPTSVIPDEQGGAYVANSTELLHLSDRNGDGRADTREVVLAGFGTEDTHHILHTFRWSPDALLCFNQSIYIHSHVETPYGVKVMLGSGIWRYQPQTARASKVMFGLINPWGHAFNAWGQGFATDGAGGQGINYLFPGAAYPTAVGFDRVMSGLNPGQPKMCGLEIISGRHFTDEWKETLIAPDFRGNRITRFRLSEEGSGYVSRQMDDLLSCNDRAFRPVDVKMAPDGSLFIADWHNPIINHGEVDFRDPRRDDRHGRIWRVTMTDRALAPQPKLADASIDELLAMLKAPEQWTRQMARIQLRLRDHQQVSEKLNAWLTALDPKDSQFEHLRLEALWVQQAIGNISLDLLQSALESSDHRVRAAAVRILSQSTNEEFGLPARTAVLPLLNDAVTDSHPQVRLEAVNALRDVHDPKAANVALQALDQKMDSWLDFALWSTVRTLEPLWGPLLENGTAKFSSDVPKLIFVLKAIDDARAVKPLMKLLTQDKIPADRLAEVLSIIGKFAGAEDARVLFDRAHTNPMERPAILNALVSISEKRKLIPGGDLKSLETMFDDPRALHLAGLWKVESLHPKLVSIALDEKAALPHREGAIRGLTAFEDRSALRKLTDKKSLPFPIRKAAIAGTLKLSPKLGASIIADDLAAATPNEEQSVAQLMDIVIARKAGPQLLAKAVDGHQLNRDIATVAVQKADSVGRRGESLATALRSAGGLKAAPKSMSPVEIRRIEVLVRAQGDPIRGENVFRRQKLACLTCHSIGGAGGQAGPDLLSLGASSPVDYIIESLMMPSAKIKENYHTVAISTVEGKVFTGIMVRDGADAVVLRDAQNREVTISKADIDERVLSPVSLMPKDLTSKLSKNELVDLVAFLSSLGKEGDFKVPQNRFIRKWQSEDKQVHYSYVNGTMPIKDLPGGHASFEINVTTPGRIVLKVSDPEELQITYQGMPVKLNGDQLEMELPAGRQRFEVAVPMKRTRPLKIEVIDSPTSTGQAEPVNR